MENRRISFSLDTPEWISSWETVFAQDIVDSPVVSVDEEMSVEEACDILLSKDTSCLALSASTSSTKQYVGLFDFADVNAFLTLAATRHTLLSEESRDNARFEQIFSAARNGKVPVKLVSNLSEKNPLETLPSDSNVIDLLSVFSRGAHRVLIQPSSSSEEYCGIISDRGLLSWLHAYANKTPALQEYLSKTLEQSSLPSLDIFDSVISCNSSAKLLDSMKLMSDEGVSSVAVLDDENGALLSAVSVTDIGKIVVPSPDNQILTKTVGQFITLIKAPYGSTDGVEKMPAYSVVPSNTLGYTIQKILATNSHRLFVTSEQGILSGIVSVVDILALFAGLANILDIDPRRMQRHRRMSSSSSHSSLSASSRSGSRNSLSRSSSLRSPGGGRTRNVNRNSMSSVDSFQRSEFLQTNSPKIQPFQ